MVRYFRTGAVATALALGTAAATGGGGGPTAPACTSTISSGLTAAIQAASAGAVICLSSSSSYGNVGLFQESGGASDVTVRPANGVTATVGVLQWTSVDHERFTGLGGTLRVGGLDLDAVDGQPTWSNHLTFDHIVWTAGAEVRVRDVNEFILFDYDTFDGLDPALQEGRVNFWGLGNGSGVANVHVTISNSHFGGGGCSDGIHVLGRPYGLQIGPGNEFTNLPEGSCGAHVDPIQLEGSDHTMITGNWFHDNGDGSGGIFQGNGDGHSDVTAYNVIERGTASEMAAGFGGCLNCEAYGNVFIDTDFVASDGSTGTVHDNVFVNGTFSGADALTLTEDYNLCPSSATCDGANDVHGTAVFVGGSNPRTFTAYSQNALAVGSPGYHQGTGGISMGISP